MLSPTGLSDSWKSLTPVGCQHSERSIRTDTLRVNAQYSMHHQAGRRSASLRRSPHRTGDLLCQEDTVLLGRPDDGSQPTVLCTVGWRFGALGCEGALVLGGAEGF